MSDVQRVAVSDGTVSVWAPGTDPLVFSLDQLVLTMLWSIDECTDHAVRGHAHLFDRDDGPLALLRLVHTRVVPQEMMSLHAAGAARSPDPTRAQTVWRIPSDPRWTFTVDAGRLQSALAGRSLVHHAAPGFAWPTVWPGFPEAFLRDPVAAWVAHEVGDVRWPAALDAATLLPGFHGVRAGGLVALTACRYGSRHGDHGQDRTAAVFLSTDRGERFDELPWDLVDDQRGRLSAEACWPPEQILSVRLLPPTADVEIAWDDPWIDWEPGTEWAARWESGARRWRMRER
jgi:hypothetical protein